MADTFVSLLGPTLKGKSGDVSTSEALAGKVVALYFSGPCLPSSARQGRGLVN
jgi:hypothetical protein